MDVFRNKTTWIVIGAFVLLILAMNFESTNRRNYMQTMNRGGRGPSIPTNSPLNRGQLSERRTYPYLKPFFMAGQPMGYRGGGAFVDRQYFREKERYVPDPRIIGAA